MRGTKAFVVRESIPRRFQSDVVENPSVQFSLFFPLGQKDLISKESSQPTQDGSINCKIEAVAPYCGLMLAGRSSRDLVNMKPMTQVFMLPQPLLPNYNMRVAGFVFTLKLQLTYLTNTKQVQAGDLLVLPFDGGCDDIILDAAPKK